MPSIAYSTKVSSNAGRAGFLQTPDLIPFFNQLFEVIHGNQAPLPPFTEESARQKVRMAEDAWNTRDPDRVVLVYTQDTRWRNRAEFPTGREEVRQFLARKWAK